MNLEDLAKKAINEVSFEIEKAQEKAAPQEAGLEAPLGAALESQDAGLELEERVCKADARLEIYTDDVAQPEESLQESLPIDPAKSQSEEIFLKNLRERILVLFEGLNAAKDGDLEQRLDLTITFLEFLLAKLEDKLKK